MNVIRRSTVALFAGLLCAASATAQVEAGQIVSQILVFPQQNRSQPSERILAVMQTRPGRPFSHITAQEDVARLMRTGWFRNVRIDTKPTADEQLEVHVVVSEYPNVIRGIIYRGAEHLSESDLDELTGLRRGTPLNPTLNRIAAQAIQRRYQEDGRYWAQVHLVEGDELGDDHIVFDIIEGPVVKVSGISFVGNVTASSGRLNTQITSSRAILNIIGGTFVPTQVDLDISAIKEYYRTLGFHSVQVEPDLVWSDDRARVQLVYHIDEGPRYTVRNVQIDGNKVYTEDQLMALTETRPGQYYDRTVIQADLQNLRDYYGLRGRLTPVNEQVYMNEDAPGTVDVHYTIEERPPDRVGRIIIQGNTVTQDRIILRQLPLYPGQILSYPDLLIAEQNLARLNIFNNQQTGERPTVQVLEPQNPNQPFRDVLVTVEEQPTGSIMLGGGINSDAGFSGSIVVHERNYDPFRFPRAGHFWDDILNGRAFRGAGNEFRLEAVPGTVFQRYTVSFRNPALWDSPYGFSTSGYYYTRGFAEFNENRYGGRVSLDRNFSPIWSASLTTRMEGVNIHDVHGNAPFEIARDAGTDFLLGLRAGIARDTRDSYIRPTSGTLLEASYEQVLGDHIYPLGSIEGTTYFTLAERLDRSGKQTLSIRSQASFAGLNTPVYERFYAGGFRSMRGFEFRGVGPFMGDFNLGGTFAFLNSIEYQLPVVANDRIALVGFIDSGAVERDIAIRDYRVSAGVGLRLSVPGMGPVPIALDFGFPIVKGQGDREQIFSFWLGYFN